ncbi:uncharacterized membrane protein YcaP (DUF421 family) [Anaerosolibacter carboniphilus]|uniref:Uncharacterized membrane protein YcaP (DUF421 family) n=1 Tax=Anaerosolibacter carboniphilus TaxID=1417629 RepID=A0A841KTA9_9FIRM|nr:DUF421 domain-containing protein [Anaerosolibacter carboniphilus]MBB6216944.1 uncharacterized membrane protein YcaP (DUF421 family) [Anaerosolibacter carboniphilus]
MLIILIRTLFIYIFVVFAIRMMGKGELTELQPFELVIMLMIAELAALSMENTGASILNNLIAIITLLFAQILISYINMKSEWARGIICGKPSVLVNEGKINIKELQRLRININDLVEQIREKEYVSLADVEFAILETNGELSIIPKANKRPVTVEDLNIQPTYENMPISLIIDGHINHTNLKIAQRNENWLLEQLRVRNISDYKDVLFCFLDENKKLYVQKKD